MKVKRQFSDRNKAVLMNVQSPTLMSALFGSCLSLPLLVSEGDGLVCESVGKADPLSDHFDSKHSREAVNPLLTFHPVERGQASLVRLGPLCWH